ncbi:hypothetical protein EJ07DRAFT_177570 [Lizonia empirigonia]|nr:hypothetical protein EJ07DRAFT_177570 [Lizonia empirigonia]
MGEHECNCATTAGSGQPAKSWNPDFLKNRRKNGKLDDRPFVGSLNHVNVQRKLLDIFLQTSEISGPSWDVERVRKFFRTAKRVEDAKLWVDYRVKDPSTANCQPRWLLSSELPEVLAQHRSMTISNLGIIRQLTFAPNVSPNVIEDLIKTATHNEIDALRHAVCQHIAGETLLRVNIPPKGFSTFQLILNLPYLVLEESIESQKGSSCPSKDKIKKLWADLSYLPLESRSGQQSDCYAIYESQTTVVIAGCDHTKWYGYAFGDIGSGDLAPSAGYNDDDTCTDDDDTGTDTDDTGTDTDDTGTDTDDTEDDDPEPEEDYFANGGCEDVLNPDQPILDPRVYFLHAAQIRSTIVTRRHEYLVRVLEAGANDWIPRVQDHGSNEKALEKITGLTILLQRLRQRFSQALRAWSRFSGKGDGLYFADLRTHPVASQALSSIEQSFEKTCDLEQRLAQLKEHCEASMTILQLRMAHENNRLTQENIILTRAMADINLKTSSHSERAAESAAKSSTAAEETSRATRVNVQLFVLSTALVIALQYFCSDRALFAFERTPRTFWISIGILMPALALVSCVLDAMDHLKTTLTKRLNGEITKVATPTATPQVPAP